MSATVDSSLSELSTTARSLSESIVDLQNKVDELSTAIGDIEIPNPESQVEEVKKVGEAEGRLELVGGTFAVGAGLHESLKKDLGHYLKIGSDQIAGAGNLETLSLVKVGKSAETLHSGMSDLSNTISEKIKDIKSLKKVMRNEIDIIIKVAESCAEKDSSVEVVIDVYKKLEDEFDSQINSLQKVLGKKVDPVIEDLKSLIRDNKSFKHLAARLGESYNTEDASDRLALAYTNLSKLKDTTSKVAKALESLKMSLGEYKQLKNIGDLEKAITKSLEESEHKSSILGAIKLLKSTFPRHKKIVEELEKSKSGGSYVSKVLGRTTKTHSTLNSRVKTYEETVNEIFTIFINQIGKNFSAIKEIFEKLGDAELKQNDQLKTFIEIFTNFNRDLENGKVFYALIGLDQSVNGREVRNRFMANLDESISALSSLDHKLLKDTRTQLIDVKNNIESYNDIINDTKKEESRLDVKGGEYLFNSTGIVNVSKTIREAIVKLKFYGNLSMFKENLLRTSKEYPVIQEDYDKLLGKSIGEKLTELKKEYVEAVSRLNDSERGRGYVLKKYNEEHPSEKIPKGLVENIYKLQYEAKVGLYKTLEAVDIYLMNFTEKVAGDVNALKNLNELLGQTELISQWADEKSLAHMTELENSIKGEKFMTYAAALASNTMVSETVANFTSGASIRKVLDSCKQAIESVAMLKNIIAMFMKIGDKFSSGSLSQENYMSSGTMYNNLVRYIWVSAFTMGHGTTGGDSTSAIPGGKGNFEIENGDKQYYFDLKMTSAITPLDLLRKFEVTLKKNVDAKISNIDNVAEQDIEEPETEVNALAQIPEARRILEIATLNNNTKKEQYKKSLKNLSESLGSKDIFQTEDKYFLLVMKAIASKIMTVVGISNLINRPSDVATMISNPVRSILGANEVTVDPEAVELYIRLPLVVEFYKSIFDDGNESYKSNKYSENNSETIAFIPEMGSKWSGLLQCIFDDSRQAKSGIYSLENMVRIISEINNIKRSYGDTFDTRAAILDLVSEVNRRYGVMKRKDIDDFYQSKKRYSSSKEVQYQNDFDILDPEEDDLDSLGPSSDFVKESFEINSSKITTSQDDISIVKDFRDLIRSKLHLTDIGALSDKSFDGKIKYFKQLVLNARDNQEKIEMIIKAIDSSNDVNNFNSDILTAYHELVIFPIDVLNKLYNHHLHSISQLVMSKNTAVSSLTSKDKALIMLAKYVKLDAKAGPQRDKILAGELAKKLKLLVRLFNMTEGVKTDMIENILDHYEPKLDEATFITLENEMRKVTDAIKGQNNQQDAVKVNTFLSIVPKEAIDSANNITLERIFKDTNAIITGTKGETVVATGVDLRNLNFVDYVFLLEKLESASASTDASIVDSANSLRQVINLYMNYRKSDSVRSSIIEDTRKQNLVDRMRSQLRKAESITEATVNEAKAEIGKILGEIDSNIKKGINMFSNEFNRAIGKFKEDNDINALAKAVSQIRRTQKAFSHWKHKIGRDMEIKDEEITELTNSLNGINVASDNASFELIRSLVSGIKSSDMEEWLERIKSSDKKETEILLDAFSSSLNFNKASLTTFIVQNFKNCSTDVKYMANNKIVIDYSKLQTDVESTLQLAKYIAGKYRHLVPKSLSDRVDSKISSLEHSYLFRMIYNQDNEKDSVLSMYNFEKCNLAINMLFDRFNKIEKESNDNAREEMIKYVYDRVCKFNKISANINDKAEDTLMLTVFREAFKTYDEREKRWKMENNALTVLSEIYLKKEMEDSSLLIKFNNLMARFVTIFFEESTKKFYSPLVDEICKSQNICIYSGKGFRDTNIDQDFKNDYYYFVEDDSVLSETLGYIIRVLTTRDVVKQLDKKYYAQSSQSEVSSNMLDRFKTYLPVFVRDFSKIIDGCIMYKKMIESMDPAYFNMQNKNTVNDTTVPAKTRFVGNSNEEEYAFTGIIMAGTNNAYSHLIGTLNNIIDASQSMIHSCKNVLMDFDYIPKHMEIKDGFTSRFQENYKTLPVAPISAIMTEVEFSPLNGGVNDYKMTKGLNYILDSDEANFPWLKSLVSQLKNSSNSNSSIDEDKIQKGVKHLVRLAKGIVEYKSLNKQGLFDHANVVEHYLFENEYSTYYSKNKADKAVSLTENSSVENSKKLLATSVVEDGKSDNMDRSKAIILNLIDMNINPINTHALMREIPLINIYNYAFTFDDIIANDFKINVSGIYESKSISEKEALAYLLIDPFYNIDSILDVVAPKPDSVSKPERAGLVTLESVIRNTLSGPVKVNDNLKLGIGKYVKEIANGTKSTALHTKFVRNMIFMTNLQRYLLSKIKNEVHRVNSRRVRSSDILSDRIISYDDENDNKIQGKSDLGLFEL